MFGFLFYWYNIPFLVALGCCVVLGLMQIVGGFGDHDIDTDVDADVDVDTDVDVDSAQVVLGDAAVDNKRSFTGILTAFGLGQTPLLLVLMVLLSCFSIIGLLMNTILMNLIGTYPSFWFFVTLVVSLLLGLWLTSRFGRMFNRISPNSSTVISFEQLVGRVGIVVSTNVSSTYGRVQVKDRFGSLHTVFAVVENGPQLPERSEVALVSYDAGRRHFVVRRLERVMKAT